MKARIFITLFLLALYAVGHAQISGTIFRDYNGNGTKDTNEPLILGIIVNAYNAANALCGTATTSGATAPNYSLSGCGTASVRVEFVLPSSGSCANDAIDYSSMGGAAYGTSVQFVNGNSTNVNFALHNPSDYNAGTTGISTFIPCYISGDPLIPGNVADGSWFVGYPYTNTGATSTTPPSQVLDGAIIGPTWGVSYSKQAKKIFTSALLKRHVGLGSLGSGGIYMLTPTATSFTVNTFYDMDANGHRTRAAAAAPAYGEGSSYSIAADNSTITYLGSVDALTGKPSGLGVIGTNAQRGLTANPLDPSFDPAAFDQVGKVGLGDIDISDDGKFLFLMNLYSRKVFRLELNSASNPTSVVSVTSYDVPTTTCTNGEYRPWGLKFYRDKLYVGVVCSAENSGTNTNLNASVYELNNPIGAATFNTTAVLTLPLDYNKSGDYNPWTKNSGVVTSSGAIRYATPILSDIEFSDNGDMLLGIMDRCGHQWGEDNRKFLKVTTTSVTISTSGDILIAGLNCNTSAFTLENNGTVTSANGTTLTGVNTQANAGPGGKEFFDDNSNSGDPHDETATGALAVLKGQGTVMLTSFAQTSNSGDAGTMKLSTTDGSYVVNSNYELYNRNVDGAFAKANGLGDIELSGSEAPIEIGNRVWLDTDADGIQDAGEAGITGVQVQLFASNGTTLLATATTDANGNYIFSNNPAGTTNANFIYNLTALQPNIAYVLKFPTTVSGNGLTTVDAGSKNTIDSDANNAGQITVLTTDIPTAGANNHTFDVGYTTVMTCSSSVTASAGPCNPTNNRYTLTGQVTLTNGPTSGTVTVQIVGGGSQTFTLPQTSPISYSIAGQISDGALKQVNVSISGVSCTSNVTYTAPVSCATSGSCNCTEYLYLNEPSSLSHKFEINPVTGALTEILNDGGPWYPGGNPINASELPSPHGLGVDRNGYLYIGENYGSPNNIRRLTSWGEIFPESTFATPDVGFLLSNIHSLNGFIYSNGNQQRIYKWDPCTGNQIGYISFGGQPNDWGFELDKNGVFYTTTPDGKVFKFTPTDADFVNNTDYPTPLIDLGANPTLGGALSPAYAFQGLQGVTVDNIGNIFVVEGDRDFAGTSSRLLKFSSTGTFIQAGPIDNTDNAGGWNQMTGVVYSGDSGLLYTSSLNVNADCASYWDPNNLNNNGTAIGPVFFVGGTNAKAIAIAKECCPVTTPVEYDINLCELSIGQKISLSELIECEGTITEGQWMPSGTITGLTFNDCDLTVTIDQSNACGTFVLTSSGPTGPGDPRRCSAFEIILNISATVIKAPVIAGNQTVCPNDNPAVFTVVTPAVGTGITYTWQQSTTSCTAGFNNIPGAPNSATYDSGPISQTTYFRVIVSVPGCNGGTCQDTSNCVTLTLGTNCGPTCNLAVTCTPVNQTSCTPPNGSASTNVTGGQGAITYIWSSGETTSTLSGKGAGTYTVTVTDNILAGCTATCQAVITSTVTLPTATCSKTDNTNCATPNGSATATATGVTYLWSNNATTSTITGLSNGTYTVTVTSTTTGCTATCSAIVGSTTTLPTATCSKTDNSNCATPNGTASVVTNGNQIAWSTGATSANITGLSAGTYTVTVTNTTTGCTNTCQAVIANSTVNPTCNISINTQPTCANLTAGSLTVTPSPAGTYTYTWSDNGAATANRTGLTGGTYTVTVTNTATGCTGVCQATLNTPTNCCDINAATILSYDCLNNGTPARVTDDRLQIGILVTNVSTSLTTFNVAVQGNTTTVTPSTGTYGTPTLFTLGAGSAGGGATFTLVLTDAVTGASCSRTVNVTDPDNCTPGTPPCPTVQCGTATIQVSGN